MGLATADRKTRSGPRNEALRRARVCYDHLAGEVGVKLLDCMRERQLVRGDDQFLELTAPGERWATELGIDLDGLRRKSRPLLRLCLDWSERRTHLSRALGAAILQRLFELRFARRDSIGRAVLISSLRDVPRQPRARCWASRCRTEPSPVACRSPR